MLVSRTRMIICLPFAIVLLYLIHKYYYEEWGYYYRYQYLSIDDSVNKTRHYKVILLWTSYQGKWTGWTGGLGHDQILRDCNNGLLNGDCVLTTDKNQIHSADVVLFSLQDLKQVWLLPIMKQYNHWEIHFTLWCLLIIFKDWLFLF